MLTLSKKINILVFFLLFQVCLYSQDNDLTIKSITFEGLKRTKISVIEKMIKPINVGSQYTSNTTNEILMRLNESNIFKPSIEFEVAQNGNDVNIVVFVEDRWTIIPSFLFSFSDSSWRLGLDFIDNNFLGYNKYFRLGGNYESTGWYIGTVYKDNQFIDNFVDMSISLSGGKEEYTHIDIMNEDKKVRMFNNYFVLSQVDFIFNVLPRFNVGVGVAYNGFWNIKDTMTKGSIQPLDTINSLGIATSLEYKIYNYQYPFEEGVAVRLNTGYQFGIADTPSYYSISGEVVGALMLHELQRIGGGIFGGVGNLPAQVEFSVAGSMGAFLLPQTFVTADYYSSINIFYEIIFLDLAVANKSPFGRSGFQIFYEAGLYDSDVIDFAYYHGPGIAFLTYLNSVSLPAIEFRYGYNIVHKSFTFSFGMFRYL